MEDDRDPPVLLSARAHRLAGLAGGRVYRGRPFLVTGTDFQNGKIDWSTCYHVSDRRFREASYIHLTDGDLLITKDGTIGKVAQVESCPEQAVLNSGVLLLRCADGSYRHRFLYHVLRSFVFENFLRINLAGSTITHLYQYVFERFTFSAPSLDEQDRICGVLDLLEQQITHIEDLIAKQEQVRAGLMQDLFTRGVDETGRLRPPREEVPELYHETALGWLPKEWETVQVRDIAHVVRGSTPRPAKDPRFFYGNFVPWITVGELSRDDWPYLETTSSQLTELGAGLSRFLPSGTLVVSNSGYGCGVPKILKISGCANDGIAALLSLSNAFDQLFLYYFFYHNIDTLRMRVARGNDQPNLNTDIIGDLWMPRPTKHEQGSIADLVWCVQQTIRRQREETEKLHHLRTALLRDLLTPPAAATAEPRIAAE
jgi:type I restriction enzyme S subunit